MRERKGKKNYPGPRDGNVYWNSFQPARKKDRSLCERVVRGGILVAGGQILSGKYLVGTQQTINWEDDSKSGREKKRRRSL